MIDHTGLRFGRMGLFDPRTDMLMIDWDEVASQQCKELISGFNLVTEHELSHRSFYQTFTFLDIASLNLIFNKSILDIWESGKQDTEIVGFYYNLGRAYNLLKEIDPLLNAYFALTLHNQKNHYWPALDENGYFKALAHNLTDDKSKKYFDIMIKLYEISLQKRGHYTDMPKFVLLYALQTGLNPIFKSPYQQEKSTPLEVFHLMSDIVLAVYDANKTQAEKIFNKILNLETNNGLTKFRQIISIAEEINYLSPSLKVPTLDELELEHRYNIYRGFEETYLKNLSNMTRQQLSEEQPHIVILKKEGKLAYKNNDKDNDNITNLVNLNLAMTHVVECVLLGKPIECFFCKVGICYEQKYAKDFEMFHLAVNEWKDILLDIQKMSVTNFN